MVMNAAEAISDSGKLTLATANVKLDQESISRFPELKAGDFVMLTISDTGIGMSEEIKARIFEPFFTTKAVGQGMGLGLSTCDGIIKQSGGFITVTSEPARGSTFKIYLPQAAPRTKVPIQRLDSPDLPKGTETILLVEDAPALRAMSVSLLGRLGYTVLAAASGIEALRQQQRGDITHIDLLMTVVVAPHINGKELAGRARAFDPHTRILFTSGLTESAVVHEGMLNAGEAFLQKPFTPSTLARKLREVLDL
jgi:CheY-like chemotaxis protein